MNLVERTTQMSPNKTVSVPLYNMRGVSILCVVAFHSVLAYLAFLPKSPFVLDHAPYLWRDFPIIDKVRWFGFDLFCAWLNIYLMTFFFFLSGLFVWSSLKRKGRHRFLVDRCLRLGIPFVLAVGLLMPIANYPTYLQSASTVSLDAYWQQWLALPFWPCGPMWFIWLLLAFDILVVAVNAVAPKWGDLLIRLSSSAGAHPVRYMLGTVIASAVAYVPMVLIFTESKWISFGPFSFQPSHLLHYCVYFFAGIGIGAYGIGRGLFAPDGWLVRRWILMLALAFLAFVLWMAATAATMPNPDAASPALQTVAALAFVLACGANCWAMLALGFKFAGRPRPLLGGLSEDAYGIYLVHYPFGTWLQFALLSVALPAIVKGPLVFAGTLLLSRAAIAALRHAGRAVSIAPAVIRSATAREDLSNADKPAPQAVRRRMIMFRAFNDDRYPSPDP